VLDELLDKINRKGYDSLTAQEKELLKKVSEYLDNLSREEDRES